MNVQPQIQTNYLGIRLSDELKARIEQEAQRRTLRSGRRVTTTDVIRYLVEAYLPAFPGKKRDIVRAK